MWNQRNWQYKCGLIIQARQFDDNPNHAIFLIPSGQDLPCQPPPPELAVQPPSTLSFGWVAGLPSEDSGFGQDIENSQKDVINSLLENQPTIQPLVCWSESSS
jgi:hypothetical protein